MKRHLFLTILFLTFQGILNAQSFIGVKGRNIISPDGKPRIAQIQQPENFILVQNYSNGNYKDWEEKVKARPDNVRTREALAQYLENCRKSTVYHKVLNLN